MNGKRYFVHETKLNHSAKFSYSYEVIDKRDASIIKEYLAPFNEPHWGRTFERARDLARNLNNTLNTPTFW